MLKAVALVGALLLTTTISSDAAVIGSSRPAPRFVNACPQTTGPNPSIGDLNVRLGQCAKGMKPIRLATWPQGRGPRGPRGVRGPRGPRGPSGSGGQVDTQVTTNASSANLQSPKRLIASCPRGTQLTGGGYSTSVLSDELVLRQSAPVGQDSWLVDVAETQDFQNNISWSLTVYVVCAH
jgi:hypothetical protein